MRRDPEGAATCRYVGDHHDPKHLFSWGALRILPGRAGRRRGGDECCARI